MKLVAIIILRFLVLRAEGAIELTEERDGKHRYITMTELEEKSAYYLKYRRGIGDEDEIKEKVKIITDRLEELYREHGLDALHDIFANEEDLEFAIGKEDIWQNFISSLIYPRPPAKWEYAKHLMVSIAATFIVAVVLATPFSFKYARRLIKGSFYNISDAEWKGAESNALVLVRRSKKRSKRVFLKPMLPRFDLKSEFPKDNGESLKNVIEHLKSKSIKDQLKVVKRKKAWDETTMKYKEEALKRRYLFEGDDDSEELDGMVRPVQQKKKVVDAKLKWFCNGRYRLKCNKRLQKL